MRIKFEVLPVRAGSRQSGFPGDGLPVSGQRDRFILIRTVRLADFVLATDQQTHRAGNTFGLHHHPILALAIQRHRLVVVGENAWAGSGRPVQPDPRFPVPEIAKGHTGWILNIPGSAALQKIKVRDQVVAGVAGGRQHIRQICQLLALCGQFPFRLCHPVIDRSQCRCIGLLRHIAVGRVQAVLQVRQLLAL